MPLGEDGLIDFRALAVNLSETVVNHAMELEADELLSEVNRRNGYRERLRTARGRAQRRAGPSGISPRTLDQTAHQQRAGTRQPDHPDRARVRGMSI